LGGAFLATFLAAFFVGAFLTTFFFPAGFLDALAAAFFFVFGRCALALDTDRAAAFFDPLEVFFPAGFFFLAVVFAMGTSGVARWPILGRPAGSNRPGRAVSGPGVSKMAR
jgi:hypothetical protein